jgi:ATP-dependent metalloprotease
MEQDIEQATKYAYAMVTRLGMSDKLGNVDLNSEYERLSSETRQLIDREIRRIVEEARVRATKVLTERRKDLDAIAQALMEYETLNRDEIDKILRGEKLPDKFKSDPAAPIKLPEPLVLPGFGEGGSRTTAVDVVPAIDEPSTPAESDGEASSL